MIKHIIFDLDDTLVVEVASAEAAFLAVMVGDSLTRDILGAQRAGLKGIWLNRSGRDLDDQVTPDFQITNLEQLHECLQY